MKINSTLTDHSVPSIKSTIELISVCIGGLFTAGICVIACFQVYKQRYVTITNKNKELCELYNNELKNFKAQLSSTANRDKHLTISQALIKIQLLDNITQKDTAKSLAAAKCLTTPVFSVQAKAYDIEQTVLIDMYSNLDNYMLNNFKNNKTCIQELNLFLTVSIARSKLMLEEVQDKIAEINPLEANNINDSSQKNDLNQQLLFRHEDIHNLSAELETYYQELSQNIKITPFDATSTMEEVLKYSQILLNHPEIKLITRPFEQSLNSLTRINYQPQAGKHPNLY
jgi:hypothetical protein